MADLSSFRKLGFIGLGAMGKPMATHLANKLPPESRIWIYDVVEKVVDDMCTEYPGRIVKAQSAKDVAQHADTIITMVPEGSHVRSVYLDAQTGICSAEIANKLAIDCSAIDTATSLAVKNDIAENFPSASFYDAPVSGGVVGAIKGTMAFFLGCAESDPNLDGLTLLMSLMGEQVIPCGAPSLGLAAKLSNNYLSGIIANYSLCRSFRYGYAVGSGSSSPSSAGDMRGLDRASRNSNEVSSTLACYLRFISVGRETTGYPWIS